MSAHSVRVCVCPALYTHFRYVADPELITKRWDVGVQCLSQRAVNRLWAESGIKPADVLSSDWATSPPFPSVSRCFF